MKYLHNNLYKMCSYFYIGVSASLLAVSTSVFAESASEQIIVGEQSSSLVQDVKQQKPYNPKDKQVAALQTRLIPYLKPSENIAYYQAIKALTWLSYAAHEGSEKSPSSARTEALQQAKYIIEALEQGQIEKFTLTTAILSESSVMRRDLWANAELLKQTEGFSCAQAEIAQAEVILVWAAAEHCELGWRHSRELFLSAQSLIDQSNLSKESIDVLNQVVTFLKDNPTYTLTLYGFTDARASEQYNLKLSMRRAQSVLAYLQQQGIHLDRVAVEAKGKNQTINDENQKFGHALSRRVELVYVDPEGKEVSTFKQRQDLQVEK